MRALQAMEQYALLWLMFLVAGIYLITGSVYCASSWPQGDEPHYLVISQTVLSYHSLDVMQDYQHGDYRSFYPRTIELHLSKSSNGEDLPVHGIGGPLLWLPFFVIAGRFGVIVFMCAISCLTVYNLYKLLLSMQITQKYALFVSLGFALASPIFIYARLTFIEPIAALFCAYALRILVQRKLRSIDLIGSSTALGLLPWLHIRFAPIESVLFCTMLYRLYQEQKYAHWRRYIFYLVPIIGLFVLYEAYGWFIWGSLNPAIAEINSGNVPLHSSPFPHLLGIFFDQEFGLFPNFPIFFFALPGLILALKKYRSFNIAFFLLFAPYILMCASFENWAGSWAPPCRFFVVLVPMLAFYVALALERARHRVIDAFFLVCTLFGFVVGVAYVGAGDSGFNLGQGENLAMAHLQSVLHITFTPYIPDLILPHQETLFTCWIVASISIALMVVLLARATKPS